MHLPQFFSIFAFTPMQDTLTIVVFARAPPWEGFGTDTSVLPRFAMFTLLSEGLLSEGWASSPVV